MRILIISDFHACCKEPGPRSKEESPSHFVIRPRNLGADIRADFVSCLTENSIKADVIICCGDLVDRTDVAALDDAWAFVNQAKSQIGAEHLLIATGNHDMDWKGATSGLTPFEFLKVLKNPRYPSENSEEWSSYWAKNYFIRDVGDARFVVFNSCVSIKNAKRKNGSFPPETQMLIEELRSKRDRKRINLCVCHHHPHKHGEFDLGEDDDMLRGQALTDALSLYDLGQWMIIHGHKHHPKISYAQGNSFSPIVFSAGSFSARLYAKLQTAARNQFHLLEIEGGTIEQMGRLVGLVKSWSWGQGGGWRPAISDEGLPARTGFGFRNVESLASRILNVLSPGEAIPWESVEENFAELRYLIPPDFRYLISILQDSGVYSDPDHRTKLIKQLVRRGKK